MADVTPEQTLGACVGALIDGLIGSGVHSFCVCPGSRSTPLALTVARHPAERLWMHLDERSAAFFGLGLAKLRREPVALICTSGTAGANFFPAVVEASYARIPLIVLTADRPHELRDRGAPQTIDQSRLFGAHAKWFVDLPEPTDHPSLIPYLKVVASQAVGTARRGPAGPVHLNCPFREPLIPAEVAPRGALPRPQPLAIGNGEGSRSGGAERRVSPSPAPLAREGSPWRRGSGGRRGGEATPPVVTTGPRAPLPEHIAALAEELRASPRGLIVCGPQDDSRLAAAVTRLAAALSYPILADPLSGVRCGSHDRSRVLDCYDLFLRESRVTGHLIPGVVLRFGAQATSKPVLLYLESLRQHPCRQIVVDGDAGWNDPALSATDIVHADAALFCEALTEAASPPRPLAICDGEGEGGDDGRSAPASRSGSPLHLRWRGAGGEAGPTWQTLWCAVNEVTRHAATTCLEKIDEPFEGKVFAELAGLLPAGATLYAGNSMPVRDLDTFFPGRDRSIRFLANRGANGIDGVVSSALGASAGTEGPLVLVIGDVSFYHDLNGLLAAKRHRLRVTIILLNNDGGGIFSFLPQAADSEHFETLFGTPHGLDFRPAVETYGGHFQRVTTWPSFRSAVQDALAADGLTVIEVPTDRARNLALHREIATAAAVALREIWESGEEAG